MKERRCITRSIARGRSSRQRSRCFVTCTIVVQMARTSLTSTLPNVEAFCRTYETGSFTRAARALSVTPQAVSRSVARLEGTLGITFFRRTTRSCSPTDAAHRYYAVCTQALGLLSNAERDIASGKKAPQGHVRISVPTTFGHHRLLPWLGGFRERYPAVKLELREAMTAQQIELLNAQQADLGFVIPPLQNADGLTSEVVARYRLVAAIPEGHPLARHAQIKLSDLAHDPWILFSARQGPGLHRIILDACARAGFIPNIGQEAPQMETIANLVAGGMGVALVSRALATGGRKGVAFCELTGPGAPVEFELAVAYAQSTPILDAFIAATRDQTTLTTS